MKFALTSSIPLIRRSMAALATVVIATLITSNPAKSVDFGQQEVDQNKFIAVASPYGAHRYQLFIFEQISDRQQCWSESDILPTRVDLLLINFDFTGICGRSTDSNGYSIREAGQDLSWRYDLDLVERDGELVLVGTSYTDPNAPPIEIGRTNGVTDGFIKIGLNPGWRFTKRTYDGKVLDHIYLTNDAPVTLESVNSVESGN